MRFHWFTGLLVGLLSISSALAQEPPSIFASESPNRTDKIFAPPPPSVLPAQNAVPAPGADGGLLPPPPPVPKIWSGSAEFGINGATGNSELFNMRTGFNARRKTEENSLASDFLYTYTHTNGVNTTQQAIYNIRNDFLIAGSRWSPFAAGLLEYDELRDYRFRFGGYGGASYAVVENDDIVWRLRAGAGVIRELGINDSSPDRWTPELVFGTDYRWKINDRSSFVTTFDYFPRVDDFSQYRLRAKANYEYILDPATGTVLRLGMQDRYDSKTGNAKKNDLTYFATLGITF